MRLPYLLSPPLFCLLCLLPAAGLAQSSQSFAPAMIDDTEVKLPIPEGQCLIGKDKPGERRLRSIMEQGELLVGGYRTLLMYTDCASLQEDQPVKGPLKLRAHGVYKVILRGSALRWSAPGVPREQELPALARLFPPMSAAELERRLGTRLPGGHKPGSEHVAGLLALDFDAFYLGMGTNYSVEKYVPAIDGWREVTAVTLLGGYLVYHSMYFKGAPHSFANALATQKRNMALMLEAN